MYCFVCLFSVDSNDRLYGCDKKFLAEINRLVFTLMEAVFEHLKSLTSEEVSLLDIFHAERPR